VIERRIARRYAKAILRIVNTDSVAEAAFLNVKQTLNSLYQNESIKKALTNTMLSKSLAKEVVAVVNEQVKCPRDVANLLIMLARDGRFQLMPFILEEFDALYNASKKRVQGELITAHPLNEQQHKSFQEALSESLRREVVLEPEQDPEILGGAVLRLGDLTFDLSIKKKLRELAENALR
jgi:F-type H+-transporting ATPase subunit delta